MEERKDDRQLELLAKIHNQLVDLKHVIVEIELARPGTSHSLQTRLRQIVGAAGHVEAEGHDSAPAPRQQRVIAPTDDTIKPGEANAQQ